MPFFLAFSQVHRITVVYPALSVFFPDIIIRFLYTVCSVFLVSGYLFHIFVYFSYMFLLFYPFAKQDTFFYSIFLTFFLLARILLFNTVNDRN